VIWIERFAGQPSWTKPKKSRYTPESFVAQISLITDFPFPSLSATLIAWHGIEA
jgi:hypothetical protein